MQIVASQLPAADCLSLPLPLCLSPLPRFKLEIQTGKLTLNKPANAQLLWSRNALCARVRRYRGVIGTALDSPEG
jgi:hypothetical protein